MLSVCVYFQVHQPERLRRYRALDVGCSRHYFDDGRNREIVRRVAATCYLPMGELLLRLIDRHQGRFKLALSISGTLLDQLEESSPESLVLFQRLAATGCVELLAETYFHSLAFLYDRDEFDRQVEQHRSRVEELFGVRPRVFCNTELIWSNALASHLEQRGFAAALARGVDRELGSRSPNRPNVSVSAPALPVLHVREIAGLGGDGAVVNLFTDCETFGDLQCAETGIFELMERLPDEVLAHPGSDFKTPSEAAASASDGAIDVPDFTSWTDVERDLSPWLGNAMQQAATRALYGLRDAVCSAGDAALQRDWQRLTTSDHLYYMCTRWFSDGDLHPYVNPHESPYEAYIGFMNVLNDLALRLGRRDDARRNVEEPHLFARSILPASAQLH